MKIRNYAESDYESIKSLYENSALYGGRFDENRDSKEKLLAVTQRDPEAILVCEADNEILGTISLIEDGRVAWLFRFAVEERENGEEILKNLFGKATQILKSRGHNEVLVYSPVGDKDLSDRYVNILGFEKGSDYTCFWKKN